MMQKKEFKVGLNTIHAALYSPENMTKDFPIVLVHGSWGASWMWVMYADFLADLGWEVCTLDLRGHGKSGGSLEGATMEDYVEDIHVVIEELELINPIVIGHSMGGLLALMYAAKYPTKDVVSIDGSPSIEVTKESKEVSYPATYTPMDAGMPSDPMKVKEALPDLADAQLMMMREKLGKESGVARSDRKRGISIPREKMQSPLLFVGAENGESLPFGIGSSTSHLMADYYGGTFIEIPKATHPGILLGSESSEAASKISEWLESKS